MLGVGSMGEVKARDVHPGIQERSKHFSVVGRRSKCADDLGVAGFSSGG